MHALYLYFLGLSFRNTARALEPFAERSHVAIWEWVQKFDPKQVYPCKRIAAFLIDETQMQIGGNEAWLWVAIESIHRAILGVYISRHRNMLVVEASNFEIPIKQLFSLISVDKTTSIKEY
jgi:putative transposase